MARWLVVALLGLVASATLAGETGVRLTITGLPPLPPGSGPVKLVDAVLRAKEAVHQSNHPTLVVRFGEPRTSEAGTVRVSAPSASAQVRGQTVACF